MRWVAARKHRAYFNVGAGAGVDAIANERCASCTMHTPGARRISPLARFGSNEAEGKKWFLLTADPAFGMAFDKATSDVEQACRHDSLSTVSFAQTGFANIVVDWTRSIAWPARGPFRKATGQQEYAAPEPFVMTRQIEI